MNKLFISTLLFTLPALASKQVPTQQPKRISPVMWVTKQAVVAATCLGAFEIVGDSPELQHFAKLITAGVAAKNHPSNCTKNKGKTMKKLLLVLSFSFATQALPVTSQNQTKQSPWTRRFAIFVRDTAIGAVIGIVGGAIMRVVENERGRYNINRPNNPGETDQPAAPGGPQANPVINLPNPYDNLKWGLIAGTIGGALCGIAEAAHDCTLPAKADVEKLEQIDRDMAAAIQFQKEELERIQARKKK